LLESLHRAIGELLPARLEHYENWLGPSGLHELGLDSFFAMVTSLRQEGDAFDLVTERAGHHAAVWSFEALPAVKRVLVRAMPRGFRKQAALRLVSVVLPRLCAGIHIDMTRRGSTVLVNLEKSPFCIFSEPGVDRSCTFCASTISALLGLLGLPAAVRASRCQAAGDRSCLLMVLLDGARESCRAGLAVQDPPYAVQDPPYAVQDPPCVVSVAEKPPELDRTEIEARWDRL
jgi:hypothetical protein